MEAYVIDTGLTWMRMSREEGEVLGTRDGDLLSDVGAGPAGELVPHPSAT